MLSYDDALQAVLKTVQPLAFHERDVTDSAGLVLAEAAIARWDMPLWDNSAMDGYAFAGLSNNANNPLEIIGAAYAGHPFTETISTAQATRITTGAPLPIGADTVIPVEEATEDAGRLHIKAPFTVKQHVRKQGEEFKRGEKLIEAGTLLQAGEISLLACAGVNRVKVYPRPRVAIISTGDELVELGEEPGPGQIVNSNMHFLTTRLQECGYESFWVGIGKDTNASLEKRISEAMDADLILTTGGVSVGEKDQVQDALSKHRFERIFWKAAIKPGKPILFGMLEETPFFGLPGNPAATAATFEILVRPALKKISGHREQHLQKRNAILKDEVKAGGKRQLFLWCRMEWSDSQYEITTQQHQNSGQNRSIQGANALLPVPAGDTKIARGEQVEVLLLE